MSSLVAFGAVLVVVSLFRDWISGQPLSTPMLLVGAGVVVGPDVLGVLDLELDNEAVVLIAEATLATLLFVDAARIDTGTLRHSLSIPARLLGIGLPLSIALGAVITAALLTDLSWSEAALVAAILAPTDAALGQTVVSDPRVPVRIRQALNVESGLNDGLAVPAVAVFAALAAGGELEDPVALVTEAATEIAVGAVVGAVIGAAAGGAMGYCRRHRLTDAEGVRLVALGGLAVGYGLAVQFGGNGFIAAFVCGLAVRLVAGKEAPRYTELAEDVGQVGASITFVLFGSMMVVPALGVATFPVIVCAVAALTVGRMLPVMVAMLGTGLTAPSIAYVGWFGPRGLASMVFGLLVVAERGNEADELFSIVSVVILASIILHGATAARGADAYSGWFAEHGGPAMAESMTVPEIPSRG